VVIIEKNKKPAQPPTTKDVNCRGGGGGALKRRVLTLSVTVPG